MRDAPVNLAPGPAAITRPRSGRPFLARSVRWRLVGLLAAGAAWLGLTAPVDGITVVSKAANVDVTIGLSFSSIEFENPLTGSETIPGYKLIEWRDADYSFGPPHWYDDWTVNNPASIDGNDNEIYLRHAGDAAWTSTTVPSSFISVHLAGDSNDGLAQVLVDGAEVARLDMASSPYTTALLVVKHLANVVHTVRVNALGVGGGFDDDVHIAGAAAVQPNEDLKWNQPPTPVQPTNVYNGWNEMSVQGSTQIAADDWRCTTDLPVTRVRWWGSYLGWRSATPPTQLPGQYQLAIWTDVPVGVESFSHPGRVIWLYTATAPTPTFYGWDYDPRTQTYEACFQYEVAIPQLNWFYQNPLANQVLWLSISAVYPTGIGPNPWGFKTRPRDLLSAAPDDAVRINAPTTLMLGAQYQAGVPLYYPTTVNSYDLAFELITDAGSSAAKWSQMPQFNPASPDCYWGWDERSTRASVQIVADDWRCSDNRPVTDIHWWGSYYQWNSSTPPSPAPTSFQLSIWTDVPVGPGNPLPYSHPGTVVWTQQVPRGQLNERAVGCDFHPTMPVPETCFRYDYNIPTAAWFTQDPSPNPRIYWLSIAAIYSGTIPTNWWGWKTREHFFQDDAVRIFSPLNATVGAIFSSGEPIENPTGVSWDAAFELTTTGPSQSTPKWSQRPVNYTPPDAFNGWNERSVDGSSQIAADDFLCIDPRPISDVHWWGSFIGWGERTPPGEQPTGFQITIWTDQPIGPEPFSHPLQVVWQHTCNSYNATFVGWDFDPRNANAAPDACFKFDCQIPSSQWFTQPGGNNVLWISIAAIYPAGQVVTYPFGCKTTPRADSLAPDDAVRVFSPTAPGPFDFYQSGEAIFWPDEAHSWDLAFQLTAPPQEQPTDDFGDAPDPPYPTLLASNGPHHTVGNLFLGVLVDPELNGQPNANATGDDLAGLPDEDGVAFIGPLVPGQAATVNVTLGGAVGGARLSAWIDFNADGSWAQLGDQIFVAQALNPGPNLLPFNVPAGATPGPTFARFRVHTNPGGIPYTGALPYGEVEDHQVVISSPPQPKWSQPPHGDGHGFDAASDVWWIPGLGAGSKWEQRPSVQFPAIHAHDGPPGTRIVAANDWYCQGGVVSDLHWWGTIEEPVGAGVQQSFQISIHANDPLTCLPLEPPLLLLTAPMSQITVINTELVNSQGETIYEYHYVLATPFEQSAGQRYWVDLSSNSVNPAVPVRWKWQMAAAPVVLCPGATKQEPSPGTWQPLTIGSAELAFRVTSTNAPTPVNRVVADDFVSDGRPITTLRWWGSYLDPRYAPGAATDPLHVLDGWLISFHHHLPAHDCPPDALAGDVPSVLAVYFAPVEQVLITPTGTNECNGHALYEYRVDLRNCCRVCHVADPRTGADPGEQDRFAEEQQYRYWLDLQAVTGARWIVSATDDCTLEPTGHLPPENGLHFWGWHTSPGPDTTSNLCGGLAEACAGRLGGLLYSPPQCWPYQAWSRQPWECLTAPQAVQMAFELITDLSPAPTLAPFIVQQPASTAVCKNDPATFVVWACGTPTLGYQWRKGGSNIGGATASQYTIASTALADAGNYDVVVTNGSGSVTSSDAVLTVWDRGTGDANLNGLTNGDDIQVFVNVLLGYDTDPHRICACDMNGVGGVTSADIPQFVAKLVGH
ncbi:MAG: GEVED domain-containing protein [Phycisphaerae bacterium]